MSAWIVVMALNVRTLIIGLGWMAAGLTVYFLYRRNQGLSPTQTVKVATPAPLGVEEVEYKSVLIAFRPGEYSDEVVATAKALAARRRRAIHILSLVHVPANLALDGDVPERMSDAQSAIERAKLIGGRRVSGEIARVRPGQSGAAIVAKAKEIDAAVVVLPLHYRNSEPQIGKAMKTVLAERPCRVIVAAAPQAAAGPVLESGTWPRPRPTSSTGG
jgi:APA family basic amino acid/polyamine antiporter